MSDDSEQSGPRVLIIAPEQAGRPLRALLAAEVGAEAASEVLAHGGLWLDGRRVEDGGQTAEAGAMLAIRQPPSGHYPDVRIHPAWILYEDCDLLALNKPAGTYVVETPWDVQGNLLAALRRYLAGRDGAAPALHPAHRLDRDTTGVLLFSKNPAINPTLQRTFEQGAARKTYLALCSGEPAEDSWTIESGHGRSRFGLFRVYPAEEIGRVLPGGSRVKAMRTRFRTLRRLGEGALVEAAPETGRTHQIRLHLASCGHPIIGDTRYGGPTSWRGVPVAHHLLHAWKLELPHPADETPLLLEAPTPDWVGMAEREP